jgi:hypothetical protein
LRSPVKKQRPPVRRPSYEKASDRRAIFTAPFDAESISSPVTARPA